MLEDRIFGNLIKPANRLARHREKLNGVKHLCRIAPADPLPGQPIDITLTTGRQIPFDSALCFFTTDDRDPASENVFCLDLKPTNASWDEVEWGYVRVWKVTLPPQPAGTIVRYHLAAHIAGTDRWVFADNQAGSAADATDFAFWVDNDLAPEWAHQALVYHVFLDRFYPGNGKSWITPFTLSGFFGGTLRGVIDKLDYIQSLYFNAIWLSPFFKSSTHHGYNASDYYMVEPRLGTNDDLKELIEKAHAKGIRLILDFVANHWSRKHFTFQDAQKDPNSPYRDWYTWKKWPDECETYFNVKELPQINLRPGPARDYLLEVAHHWLREGFDGYRLDFANGPPHGFWIDFRRTCLSVKPDCLILGEVVHTAAMQRSYIGVLDGTLDFLLSRALRETFGFERWSLDEFEAFLSSHEAYFPAEFVRPSFLDNHDMNRFLYIAGNDKSKVKLGALVMYTLSGPPIVYNGTEAGVTQERPMQQGNRYIFEEARLPMKWDSNQDADLLDHFRCLGRLRHEHPVLHRGGRKLVHIDSTNGTYAYLREDKTEKVLVTINLSRLQKTLFLPAMGFASGAREHLYNLPVQIQNGSLVIILPPRSGGFIC